jgi:hypothetical protein
MRTNYFSQVFPHIFQKINTFGKSLIYHTKRVNEYLSLHNEIDLSKPFEFYKLDEKTNPQYVIGAVLCDLILEKVEKRINFRISKN